MDRESMNYQENKSNFKQGQQTNVQNIRAYTYRGGIRL